MIDKQITRDWHYRWLWMPCKTRLFDTDPTLHYRFEIEDLDRSVTLPSMGNLQNQTPSGADALPDGKVATGCHGDQSLCPCEKPETVLSTV